MKKWIGVAVGLWAAVGVALAARLRHAKRVATPRRPFSWAGTRVAMCLAIVVGMFACVGLARAGSPVQVTGTVATNGTSLSVPASGSMAFKLQAVVFGSVASTSVTHTVSLVHGIYTNQLTTKVVSATDCMLSVTNAPWLFSGDKVWISTTSTNAFGVVVIGETGS